jgi:glutamate/tyrosine decarboxylase-like PLP-dependent enzyme
MTTIRPPQLQASYLAKDNCVMNPWSEAVAVAAKEADEYLDHIASRAVHPLMTADALRTHLDRPLPARPEAAADVIRDLGAIGSRATVATQGPRYFGFVIGGNQPAAMAADWLVSAWDQNAGVFVLSPLVSVVEDVTGRWLRELAGFPGHWSHGFVTGCQMANFTALAAARHHVLDAAGWDVGARGLFDAPAIDVVVSDESHYTIFNALRMLGLGSERVRRVPTDDQGRMRGDALRRALEHGAGPCIVCAQAGNVNTGAFDPLEEIAEACGARGAWLHVDGAFGFWAVASPVLWPLVTGLARADSVATDAHKWLNVPYDSGIVFTAHRESHRRAMTLSAAYIIEDASERDPHEFVPEESRRARAVPVYAALRAMGGDGLRALVERCCALAARMRDRLVAAPPLRVLNDVVLNQVLVRVEPPGVDADAATREVIARVQRDGTCWLGGTTWQGMAAMRISVSNWSTTADDIDRSAEAIVRALRG